MDLGRLTLAELQALDKSRTIAVIPVGSFEAHGPHLPLGTDNLIPARLIERLEAEHGEELAVAPAVPYGHSWELKGFGGTVNLPTETLAALALAVGRALRAAGLRWLVFWNGHGGNLPALTEACEHLGDEGATAATLTWWLDFSAEVRRHVPAQGHAGADETALLLATDPELVRTLPRQAHPVRLGGLVRAPDLGARLYPRAFSGDPARATPEAGRAMLDALARLSWERLQAIRSGDWLVPQ